MRGSEEKTMASFLREALERLKAGQAEGAVEVLEDALRIDCEDEKTLYTLRCVHWWREKLAELEEISTPYDKGYFIMGQWGAFDDFLETLGTGLETLRTDFDRCRYAVRHFVYGAALESFQMVLSEGSRHDPDLLLSIGRCYKGVGNYDAALEYLQDAARHMKDDGSALAELADVHALLGDSKKAKVLFREAFFMDPQGVELYSLESEMITSLIKTVQNEGKSGDALKEWIPVYGAFLGVFSVKRELKMVELGKLKHSVFTLENDVRANVDNGALLRPKLLNKYLWLLDHFEKANEDSAVNEILSKIQFIYPEMFERYMSIK